MRFLRPSLGILLLAPLVWLTPVTSTVARTAPSTDQDEAERVPPGHHRVLRGETLWSIAMRYNTSVGELMDANHLDNGKLKPGQLLRLPSSDPPPSARHSRSYVVEENDTLRSIARSYHVTEKALREANPKINFQRLKQGVHLSIPRAGEPERSEEASPPKEKATDAPSSSPHGSQTHVIKGDETFASLARRYGLKVSDIMAANPDVKPERLREGMVIKLPSKKHASSGTAPAKDAPQEQTSSTPKEKHSHASKDIAAQKTPPADSQDPGPPPAPAKHNASSPAKTAPKTLANQKPKEQTPSAKEDEKPAPTTPKHPANTGDKKASSTVASKKDASNKPALATSDTKKPTEKPSAEAKKNPPAVTDKTAEATPPPPPQSVKTDNATGEVRSYIVQPGETSQAIAQTHGITVKRLLDYNHLSADAKLRPGDEIMIPKRGNVAVNR